MSELPKEKTYPAFVAKEQWTSALRAARHARGLSDLEIAARMGVDLKQFQKWEAGTGKPRIGSFVHWAKIVGFHLELSEDA